MKTAYWILYYNIQYYNNMGILIWNRYLLNVRFYLILLLHFFRNQEGGFDHKEHISTQYTLLITLKVAA
jgi:hypothetical protein